MKRVLLALLGLMLLAILAYFCFQNKADLIREDLVSSTTNTLSRNNINGVTAELKGNYLEMTDIITLSGEVASLEIKAKAESLTRSVSGVGGVENQLTIAEKIVQVETPAPTPEEATPEEATPEEATPEEVTPEETTPAKDKESNTTEVAKIDPYTLTIMKDANNTVTINGYVESEERKEALLAYANELFGAENVTDDLKVATGAPEDWEYISTFALDRLKDVDYGDMKLNNQSYEFTGHLPSPSKKLDFLDGIRAVMSDPENKYSRYRGDYIITAPIEEPTVTVEVTKKESTEKEVDANETLEKSQTATKEKLSEPISPIEICQSKVDSIVGDKKILFQSNKASLKKDSYQLLNTLLQTLQECHVSEVEIAGHTDSTGLVDYNKRLSNLRAASVKRYLIKKGFDKTKIKAIGYGATKPIASNKSKEGRAKNRRIEFIVKEVEK